MHHVNIYLHELRTGFISTQFNKPKLFHGYIELSETTVEFFPHAEITRLLELYKQPMNWQFVLSFFTVSDECKPYDYQLI
jgi:hypothetical protein